MQSETTTASARAAAHPRATHATAHRAKPMMSTHRAKGAGSKPMMERRTTAIPATHEEGEAAEETSEQSPSHKQPTAAEQEGKNKDNHDET